MIAQTEMVPALAREPGRLGTAGISSGQDESEESFTRDGLPVSAGFDVVCKVGRASR